MRKLQLLLQMRFTNSLRTEMTKFIIDITLDGRDPDEEMFNPLTGDEVREVLQDYGFYVIKVEEIEE